MAQPSINFAKYSTLSGPNTPYCKGSTYRSKNTTSELHSHRKKSSKTAESSVVHTTLQQPDLTQALDYKLSDPSKAIVSKFLNEPSFESTSQATHGERKTEDMPQINGVQKKYVRIVQTSNMKIRKKKAQRPSANRSPKSKRVTIDMQAN